MRNAVTVGLWTGVAIVAIAAGYYGPQMVWTRASVIETLRAASDLHGIKIGNSRVPCRGPNGEKFIFGYAMGVNHRSMPGVEGSGSACWDLTHSAWVWRVDQPLDHMSSNRTAQRRGLQPETSGSSSN